MLALLVLAVIHALMLGVARVRVGGRSRLRRHWGSNDERDRADKRLHVKFSKAVRFENLVGLQDSFGGGVAISG
jgi:hypothetical protein